MTPCYYPRTYEISSGADDQDRRLHHHPKAPPDGEVCHRPAARAAAHLQPDLHRLRPHPRVFHLAQGHHAPGGLPERRGGVQRPDDLDLRRRTAHLSADRGARARPARAEADRLHLHERDVHAQEDARMAGGGIAESGYRKAERAGVEIKPPGRARIGLGEGRRSSFARVRKIRQSRPSARAAGCIGTCTSMASSGRTI